jgi:hypothetical protein
VAATFAQDGAKVALVAPNEGRFLQLVDLAENGK